MPLKLDTPSAGDALYLDRGRPIDPWRPILQGDVFEDVEIPGLADHERIMLVSHPCSMRGGDGVLKPKLQAVPVDPHQAVPLDRWATGHLRVLPLPDLLEDGSNHAARLTEFGMVETGTLDLDHRIACLSEHGSEVREASLRAVLSHKDPTGGIPLPGLRKPRVPGFDLMFSVPKSASVLFGIGDGGVQKAILDAQQVAVAEALCYLEARACRTRRGAGGCEVVQGEGFVGAAFRHRTSRAGDPQVHTHVLVANATRTTDQSWGTLDGRAVYAEARTAGFVHEAVFRRELTRRLAVRWGPVRNGIADIEGVPLEVREAFSRRKAEIEAQVAEWGLGSAVARQSAAVQTRERKDYGVTPERLAPEWRSRAAALGLDYRELDRLFGHERTHATRDDQHRAGLADELASARGLTEQQSTFDRRDIVRAYAEAATQGASLAEIDGFVEAFERHDQVVTLEDAGGGLRRQDVIRRRDGQVVSAMVESPRYSTVELLELERHVLETAVRAQDAGGRRPCRRRGSRR